MNNPIGAAARRTRREEILGENPICLLCGEKEFWALILAPEKLLENHHVAGKAHDPDLTLTICLNCHARQHELLRVAGASMKPANSFLERLALILRGLGVHLQILADKFVVWAQMLLDLVTDLDAKFPKWRECEGAK